MAYFFNLYFFESEEIVKYTIVFEFNLSVTEITSPSFILQQRHKLTEYSASVANTQNTLFTKKSRGGLYRDLNLSKNDEF